MDSEANNIEKFLKERILSELERGRPNFDKPHTSAVVHWLKKIIEYSPDLNLDKDVLLIAAYAHDWGYADMFSHGQQLQYSDVKKAKSEHMRIGANKIGKLLRDDRFSFLSEKKKMRCIHLVKVHDILIDLKDHDELVLMEADTLGGLDTNFVKPTFDFESNEKYMRGVKEGRVPKFITKYGKKTVATLIKRRIDYYLRKQ